MNSSTNHEEDIFDSVVNLEKAHLSEGYADGYNDGLISGKEEGREVGLKQGFQVGEELGFYRGCIDVWNSAIRTAPNCFSPRVHKNIKQMEDLLEKYPLLEPENENIQDIVDSLRLKFRAIEATLGARLEYEGYPKEVKEEF